MTYELQALNAIFLTPTQNTLWCVDENIGDFSPVDFNGLILSNRFDIHQHLVKKFPNALFNDFDFTFLTTTNIDRIIFRIAKEKAINHHIIEQAFQHLENGSNLVLLGYKNEGILSICSKILSTFNCKVTITKHKAQLQRVEISIPFKQAQSMGEANYSELKKLNIEQLDFYSKPGVFGWNKIDKGSELLIECLKTTVKQKQSANLDPFTDKKVLDLGCGYGYLSMKAHEIGFTNIDATDNNAAALSACKKNFEQLSILGNVFADNHGEHCTTKYDLILCNPPFHQGFDHTKNLTEVFVAQASSLLKPKGEAYFVTNQFIGIEKIAAQHFSKCELIDKNNGFKAFLFKK